MENIKKIFKPLVYSRIDAVRYAEKYAINYNKKYIFFGVHQRIGGDCTNFVSQCLHAGGAPYSYDRRNSWWYNPGYKEICSLSWSVAHSLYWYLMKNHEKRLRGIKGYETDVSSIEPGDLVFYENKRGLIFHSAIVTGFKNVPLISQHSVNALNVSYIKPYYVAKNHMVKIYG